MHIQIQISGESTFPRQFLVYWVEQCRTEQNVSHGWTAGEYDAAAADDHDHDDHDHDDHEHDDDNDDDHDDGSEFL